MIGAAFGLFRGASLFTQLITLAVIFSTLAAAYFGWKTHVYNSGWRAAIAAIAAQDKRAVDAAKAARVTFRSCVDAGGVWDVTAGKCERR